MYILEQKTADQVCKKYEKKKENSRWESALFTPNAKNV